MFKKAKWIWQNEMPKKDEFADFYTEFTYAKKDGAAELFISADTEYCVYINGVRVNFGQYRDYPHYKVYDKIDVTSYLKDGKNALAIELWYWGIETASTYIKGDAGLCFALCQGDNVLAKSGKETLSRLSKTYIPYQEKWIDHCIGITFSYDATKEDAWKTGGGENFAPSIEQVGRALPSVLRPIKRLETGAAVKGKFIKQDGKKLLFDFGKELVGIANLRFTSKKEQQIRIAYGEHIQDGWIRDCPNNYDFSFTYKAKKGENEYFAYPLRMGLRYISFEPEEEVDDLTVEIYPRNYPIEVKPFTCKDEELQRIYDVCLYTLQCCMHDHYEDCPWREQALYALDSRNQMLCGYYAFKGYEFPKSCLKLMSQDRREDGLLSICFPAGAEVTIPAFSFHFITAVREYGDYSGDWAFVEEILPKILDVFNIFLARQDETDGLLKTFEGKWMWNFYEWAEGLQGTLWHAEPVKKDLILNAFFSIAAQNLGYICDKLGKPNTYAEISKSLNLAINKAFWKEDKGEYTMNEWGGVVSELGNALAILCGAATGERAAMLAEKLSKDSGWSEITLSMKCFKYDAMLKTDKAKYAQTVLNDIRRVYNKMLDAGATTVWETEKGADDMDGGSGSLCHGWSALPVYYLQILQ